MSPPPAPQGMRGGVKRFGAGAGLAGPAPFGQGPKTRYENEGRKYACNGATSRVPARSAAMACTAALAPATVV